MKYIGVGTETAGCQSLLDVNLSVQQSGWDIMEGQWQLETDHRLPQPEKRS